MKQLPKSAECLQSPPYEETTVYVTLAISQRDEGLRIRAMAPYEEAYIAGPNKDHVFSDIGPVLQTILHENHGIDWVTHDETQTQDGREKSYAKAG